MPTPRTAEILRRTNETDIRLKLTLDGTGAADLQTGIGFFDHMLTLLAKHALFDLEIAAAGDLEVDQHHTVEDVGICFGQALATALGDKAGIVRYGSVGDVCGGPQRPILVRWQLQHSDREDRRI